MKVYYTQPKQEARIVKPESDNAYYEFWLLKPVYVGSARGEGPGRVVSEDGHHFTNLRSALRHLLMDKGETDLADEQELFVTKRAKPVQVSGMDMVLQGKWAEFCAMRKLNPREKSLMDANYELNREEIKKLGLEA